MILDIVVVALIALSVFLGYRKGLVKLAIGIVSLLLSLVITGILYIPLSNLVVNVTNIDETIENAIYEKAMENAFDESATKNTTNNNNSTSSNNRTNNNTSTSKSATGVNASSKTADSTSLSLTQAVAEGTLPAAARGLSVSVVRLGVFIVLCLASRVIIGILAKFADALANLPLIKQFNKTGGIICGLIRGVLVAYVALLLVAYITQINPDNSIYKSIQDSYITKVMYENNIIGAFFKVKLQNPIWQTIPNKV